MRRPLPGYSQAPGVGQVWRHLAYERVWEGNRKELMAYWGYLSFPRFYRHLHHFFGTLTRESISHRQYRTQDKAAQNIVEYTEVCNTGHL
jgi:hypothetical protein